MAYAWLLAWISAWILVFVFACAPSWTKLKTKAALCVLQMQGTWLYAVKYLINSRDKAWSMKDVKDAGRVDLNDPRLKRKTIILLRHGESSWNEVFNRGFGPGFLIRLIWGILHEFYLMTFNDSYFIDSPLSTKGHKQAEALFEYISNQAKEDLSKRHASTIGKAMIYAQLLHKDADKNSKIVSSNLRRAMATAVVSLQNRIVHCKEKIEIVSYLQEISRNVDTISLSSSKGVQSNLGGKLSSLDTGKLFETQMNVGNKKASHKGLERIQLFMRWLFLQKEHTIIATGHSLYFRELFKMYLPKAVEHVSKKRKVANCGIIAAEVVQDSTGLIQILPDSITPVYLGFSKR